MNYNTNTIYDLFIKDMASHGIVCHDTPIADGRLHRFTVNGDKQNTNNGWYVLHEDGVPNGVYGSWKSNEKYTWCGKSSKEVSAQEQQKINTQIARAVAEREINLIESRKQAKQEANTKWREATAGVVDHPYLKEKRVLALGIRSIGKSLVIPIADAGGVIHSLQFINAEGSKLFLKGGAKKGNFHLIGDPGKTIYLAEGYASAATIYAAEKVCTVVAFDAGNLLPVAKALNNKYPNSSLIIVADNDQFNSKGENPGVSKATEAANAVDATLIIPTFRDISSKPTDINDLLALEGMEEVRGQLNGNEWKKELIHRKDRNGENTSSLKTHHGNVRTILQWDKQWRGLLQYDEFSDAILVTKKLPGDCAIYSQYPRQWGDEDDAALSEWLFRHPEYQLSIASKVAASAVPRVARRNIRHPVKEYLSSLKWDGRKRLNTWLITFFGAKVEQGNEAYMHEVAAKWMISAVARIFQPGCKVDSMLVLEGKQGAGKSHGLRILAGEKWFTDEIGQAGFKDTKQDLRGVWIIEFSELESLSRQEVGQTKAFISRQVDRYRPSYGRYAREYPRQCIFCGSTNEGQYLKDSTGGRRFWPVKCHEIDKPALSEARDQLWAEAVARYQAGENWWLSAEVEQQAMAEQSARYQEDPWEESIIKHIEGRLHPQIKIEEIMDMILFIPKDKQNRSVHSRIRRILMRLGLERKRKWVGKKQEWFYV